MRLSYGVERWSINVALSSNGGPRSAVVQPYLGTMVEAIQKYQGTKDEFIGNAIFMVFGTSSSGRTMPNGWWPVPGPCNWPWRG